MSQNILRGSSYAPGWEGLSKVVVLTLPFTMEVFPVLTVCSIPDS